MLFTPHTSYIFLHRIFLLKSLFKKKFKCKYINLNNYSFTFQKQKQRQFQLVNYLYLGVLQNSNLLSDLYKFLLIIRYALIYSNFLLKFLQFKYIHLQSYQFNRDCGPMSHHINMRFQCRPSHNLLGFLLHIFNLDQTNIQIGLDLASNCRQLTS